VQRRLTRNASDGRPRRRTRDAIVRTSVEGWSPNPKTLRVSRGVGQTWNRLIYGRALLTRTLETVTVGLKQPKTGSGFRTTAIVAVESQGSTG
jgi:hypothetical protein